MENSLIQVEHKELVTFIVSSLFLVSRIPTLLWSPFSCLFFSFLFFSFLSFIQIFPIYLSLAFRISNFFCLKQAISKVGHLLHDKHST